MLNIHELIKNGAFTPLMILLIAFVIRWKILHFLYAPWNLKFAEICITGFCTNLTYINQWFGSFQGLISVSTFCLKEKFNN
jgi:hypothetical protein